MLLFLKLSVADLLWVENLGLDPNKLDYFWLQETPNEPLRFFFLVIPTILL